MTVKSKDAERLEGGRHYEASTAVTPRGSPLLEHPRVAVRVCEVGEAGVIATLRIQPRAPSTGPRLDRVLVPDRADRDAAGDQLRPLGREVGCNEVELGSRRLA